MFTSRYCLLVIVGAGAGLDKTFYMTDLHAFLKYLKFKYRYLYRQSLRLDCSRIAGLVSAF